MYPILLCSLIAVYVAVDRFLILYKAKTDLGPFLLRVKEAFKVKDVKGVEELCSKTHTPVAVILNRGIEKYSYGEEKVKEAIEVAGREEIYRLEKKLSWLATIAGVAPMLGFLGTVTGMIEAFQQVESIGSNVSPSNLAGGIWEALITTAYGLIVGIPSYAFYNFFISKIEHFVYEMEVSSNQFLDMLNIETAEIKREIPKYVPPTVKSQPTKRSFGDEDIFEV